MEVCGKPINMYSLLVHEFIFVAPMLACNPMVSDEKGFFPLTISIIIIIIAVRRNRADHNTTPDGTLLHNPYVSVILKSCIHHTFSKLFTA